MEIAPEELTPPGTPGMVAKLGADCTSALLPALARALLASRHPPRCGSGRFAGHGSTPALEEITGGKESSVAVVFTGANSTLTRTGPKSRWHPSDSEAQAELSFRPSKRVPSSAAPRSHAEKAPSTQPIRQWAGAIESPSSQHSASNSGTQRPRMAPVAGTRSVALSVAPAQGLSPGASRRRLATCLHKAPDGS